MASRICVSLAVLAAAAACSPVPPSTVAEGAQSAVPVAADPATRELLESLDVAVETRLAGARRDTLSTR